MEKVDWQQQEVTTMSAYVCPSSRGETPHINRAQLWSIESKSDDRNVTYLATLTKHQQAVNVVRWHPRGILQCCVQAVV